MTIYIYDFEKKYMFYCILVKCTCIISKYIYQVSFHSQHKGCGQISLSVYSGESEGAEPVTGTACAGFTGSMAVISTVSS